MDRCFVKIPSGLMTSRSLAVSLRNMVRQLEQLERMDQTVTHLSLCTEKGEMVVELTKEETDD